MRFTLHPPLSSLNTLHSSRDPQGRCDRGQDRTGTGIGRGKDEVSSEAGNIRITSTLIFGKDPTAFATYLSSQLRNLRSRGIVEAMRRVLSVLGRSMERRAFSSSNSASAEHHSEVLLTTRKGNSVFASINRPKALNSLNLDVVREVRKGLAEWNKEGCGVGCFVLKGVGGKAFCAGGDVKSIWQDVSPQGNAQTGGRFASDFFSTEYRMNSELSTSSVPQVSLWDGVVMGGGVGISIFGQYRISTDKTLFAMPETAIGLFPDVGSSYWLSKLGGGYGEYLGLTGTRMNGKELRHLGIATHYIPSERLEALEEEIASKIPENPTKASNDLKAILSKYEEPIEVSEEMKMVSADVSAVFESNDNFEQIITKLENYQGSSAHWAEKTMKSLVNSSPTSLKLTFSQINRARAGNLSLQDCLRMVSTNFIRYTVLCFCF